MMIKKTVIEQVVVIGVKEQLGIVKIFHLSHSFRLDKEKALSLIGIESEHVSGVSGLSTTHIWSLPLQLIHATAECVW